MQGVSNGYSLWVSTMRLRPISKLKQWNKFGIGWLDDGSCRILKRETVDTVLSCTVLIPGKVCIRVWIFCFLSQDLETIQVGFFFMTEKFSFVIYKWVSSGSKFFSLKFFEPDSHDLYQLRDCFVFNYFGILNCL